MQNSAAASANRYLVFRLKSLLFALRILGVEDVVELDPLSDDADMARQLAATCGTAVPVVDLRPKEGTRAAKGKPDDSERHFVIVVETEYQQKRCVLGFVADGVAEIVELDANDVLVSTEAQQANGPASRVAKLGARTVRLLDIEKVLQNETRPKPRSVGSKKLPRRSTVTRCS
jgi:chemotaxis signal transduction protein